MAFLGYKGKTLRADRVRSVSGELNLQWFGAIGTGNVADAAANAAALAAAVAEGALDENRGLYLPRGLYYFPDGLAFADDPVRLIGDPGQTFIAFAPGAAGPMLTISGAAGAIAGVPMHGSLVQDLTLVGHADMTYGLLLQNVHQSSVVRVAVEDCTDAGFRLETVVDCLLEAIVCSSSRRAFLVQPDYGLFVTQRAGDGAATSTGNTFVDAVLEGLTLSAQGIGINVHHGVRNEFHGCASNGNKRGLVLGAEAGALAEYNLFSGALRGNVTDDVEFAAAAEGNILDDVYSEAAVNFLAGSRANILRGGFYGDVITNLSALAQRYDGISVADAASLVDAVTVANDCRYYDRALNEWSSS